MTDEYTALWLSQLLAWLIIVCIVAKPKWTYLPAVWWLSLSKHCMNYLIMMPHLWSKSALVCIHTGPVWSAVAVCINNKASESDSRRQPQSCSTNLSWQLPWWQSKAPDTHIMSHKCWWSWPLSQALTASSQSEYYQYTVAVLRYKYITAVDKHGLEVQDIWEHFLEWLCNWQAATSWVGPHTVIAVKPLCLVMWWLRGEWHPKSLHPA